MITIEQAIKIAKYEITSGSEYGWKCYGPNARFLDFTNTVDVTFSIIFDTNTQTVYEANISDNKRDNYYRIINPDYIDEYRYECDNRNVVWNQVYDDVRYKDLESVDDFIEKATAIVNGETYDERVTIDLDLPEDELYVLMTNAHNMDMTLNDYLAHLIEKFIEESE